MPRSRLQRVFSSPSSLRTRPQWPFQADVRGGVIALSTTTRLRRFFRYVSFCPTADLVTIFSCSASCVERRAFLVKTLRHRFRGERLSGSGNLPVCSQGYLDLRD